MGFAQCRRAGQTWSVSIVDPSVYLRLQCNLRKHQRSARYESGFDGVEALRQGRSSPKPSRPMTPVYSSSRSAAMAG
jgi:hypothetical protein